MSRDMKWPASKPIAQPDFEGNVKISPEALGEVLAAFEVYKEQVERSNLRPNSKNTYVHRAGLFLRWLYNDFQPGSTLPT